MPTPPLLRIVLRHSITWTPKCTSLKPSDSVHIQSKRFNHTSHTRSPKKARTLTPILTAVVLCTATYYALTPSCQTTLNSDTFTPYTITSRQAISPTSALFTISAHQHDHSPPYLLPHSSQWKHPLWSVEFKQPEVQIARHYTPLPPAEGEDARDGTLSFYVRAVGGGEMSNYLNKLGVGQDVYLRGPHPGFDILSRLGGQKTVVFLAGGTGVVPGLQVAKAVLEKDATARVDLLWAVRKREELQKCTRRGASGASWPWWAWWGGRAPGEVTSALEEPSALGRQLVHMKGTYGERLRIRVAVDEERTFFTKRDIQEALASRDRAEPGRGCRLHDQRLHTRASEFEDPGPACQCPVSEKSGKNLFMISGPDGFIAHYAGYKTWLGGTLTQGSVGGVVGEVQSGNPALANDWLVLKL